MAMIIVYGNEILRQKEGEQISDFCERAKIWDSSQSGSQPVICECGATKMCSACRDAPDHKKPFGSQPDHKKE